MSWQEFQNREETRDVGGQSVSFRLFSVAEAIQFLDVDTAGEAEAQQIIRKVLQDRATIDGKSPTAEQLDGLPMRTFRDLWQAFLDANGMRGGDDDQGN